MFELFGVGLDWVTLDILLPVGISFYTFQALSYTIDVYKRKIVNLCVDNNVKLFFIRLPWYGFKKYEDSDYYYSEYLSFFSKIPLLDYVDFSLPDSCYADMTHLNYRGAKIFTEQLKKDFYGE